MQKSQAYKILAIHQFDNPLPSNDVTGWLMENDPVTLCKALGLYVASKNAKRRLLVDVVDNLVMLNEPISAIKHIRTELNLVWLKEAKQIFDVYIGNKSESELNEYESSLYVAHFKPYKKG